jgi:DNA repair protein RadC
MSDSYGAGPGRDADAPSPRERLVRHGPQALSTTELLSLLLRGSDEQTPSGAAEALLKRYHGLRGIARATVKELSKVKGIGPVKGMHLAVCVELGRRLAARTAEPNPIVRSPEDVADLLLPEVMDAKKEHFFAVLLDKKNRVLRVHTVSIGILDASLAHPREVFSEAIAASAAAVIVAHNHPRGDPEPSEEDRHLTNRLIESGRILGIPVLDHLVLGDDRWVSLKERGWMQPGSASTPASLG